MSKYRWMSVVIFVCLTVGCAPAEPARGGTTAAAGASAGAPPSSRVPPGWTPVRRTGTDRAPVRPVYVDPATGIGFPPTAGGLRYRGIRRYNSAALGFSVRYQNTGDTWADVYVYPGFVKKAPESVRSAAMARHFRQVEGDIVSVARRGYYLQFRRITTRLRRVGRRELWEGRYTYVFRGQAVGSLLYLTGYRAHFVKVRFTFARSRRTAALAEARGLLRDLLGALR